MRGRGERQSLGVTKAIAALFILLFTLGLSACGITETKQLPPMTTTETHSVTETAQPAQKPQAVKPPPSEADSMVPRVRQAVQQLAARSSKPTREEFRATLMPFAADPSGVEVSVSTTVTGLAADSIFGSVRTRGSCIMSGIEDGKAVTSLLPVLTTGLCFVGSQR